MVIVFDRSTETKMRLIFVILILFTPFATCGRTPSAKRLARQPANLITGDVAPQTVMIYSAAISKFENFLAFRSLPTWPEMLTDDPATLTSWLVVYIQAGYNDLSMGRGQLGALISGLRRQTRIMIARGQLFYDTEPMFKTL